jgi:hypothetical protein
MSKTGQYFYDAEAVKEPAVCGDHARNEICAYQAPGQAIHGGLRQGLRASKKRGEFDSKYNGTGLQESFRAIVDLRNLRDVWTIQTQPCKEAHFATFPERLVETCLKAGTRPGDLVCDPFMGSGTVAAVAEKFGRRWIGTEINPNYIAMQDRRLARTVPLLKWGGGVELTPSDCSTLARKR